MSMTADRNDDEVASLLTRESRAALPLWRQLVLYLDPSPFFKDASTGPECRRARAASHNRSQRLLLLAYIRRWLLIAGCSFLGIASAETLAAHAPFFIIPAVGFGIGCSVALTAAMWATAAYLLLGTQAARSR